MIATIAALGPETRRRAREESWSSDVYCGVNHDALPGTRHRRYRIPRDAGFPRRGHRRLVVENRSASEGERAIRRRAGSCRIRTPAHGVSL
jgi:hypothetical protein